jgi:Tfp pilus assembly PilM family ATPase
MALSELKSTMQFEAGQYIPLPRDEVILDCAIVKGKAEENKMLVVLAAVKKAIIYERISLLEKAGLTARVIDVDCFCLSNAFNHSYQWAPPEAKTDKSEVIGLLNIGANSTNMVILDNGTLRFSRDIAFGGSELSLNNLAGEISSSIDYFENQSGKRLEKAYLSGGAADASGMVNFLNHQLGIAVAYYDFFSGLKQGPAMNTEGLKAKGNSFVIALGLVLR